MLNVKQLMSAKGRDTPYKLTDTDGLHLFVAPTGLRSWRYNYSEGGKQKTKTYGKFPELGLAEACLDASSTNCHC